MIQHISAVTLAVRAMPEALAFYTKLGFSLVYGGPAARFSTLQVSEAFVNLLVTPSYTPTWWGRTRLCRKFSCEAIWGMLSPRDAE
jgi:catechol 2,3-dioxygenase-like lactoylglutathione lyase family enzyme